MFLLILDLVTKALGPKPISQSDICDARLALEIMRSNYKAFEAGPVDWVTLALSPMAGKEMWLNLMEEQAKQLSKSQPVLGAMCFLACSKVYEAIDVYSKANMHR